MQGVYHSIRCHEQASNLMKTCSARGLQVFNRLTDFYVVNSMNIQIDKISRQQLRSVDLRKGIKLRKLPWQLNRTYTKMVNYDLRRQLRNKFTGEI
jgi:hypothetical protein